MKPENSNHVSEIITRLDKLEWQSKSIKDSNIRLKILVIEGAGHTSAIPLNTSGTEMVLTHLMSQINNEKEDLIAELETL